MNSMQECISGNIYKMFTLGLTKNWIQLEGLVAKWWGYSRWGDSYKIQQCCNLQSKANLGHLKTLGPTALGVFFGWKTFLMSTVG